MRIVQSAPGDKTEGGHVDTSSIVEPLGMATFTLLWITALLGLNQWKLHLVRIRPGWHYSFAILALISAAAHLIAIKLS